MNFTYALGFVMCLLAGALTYNPEQNLYQNLLNLAPVLLGEFGVVCMLVEGF